MRSVTPSGRNARADGWICTSIFRFTGPAPFYVEPRRHKHEREESNPVRQDQPSVGARRLAALPGAHSCIAPALGPGAWVSIYFSSSTFQYASLMNFDQLSMRKLWAA